jgi:TolB-like protein/DNA-binding winged helix-turn-helix (wHTH) protein
MAIHALGPFRLDTESGLLLRGTERVALGSRAIALLQALLERPGTVVSKEALIEAAWPGQIVEESNLTVQIAALRRVLGEAAGGEGWIATMPRRGYRFIGPAVTDGEGAIASSPRADFVRDPAVTGHDEDAAGGAAMTPALTLPDKPSIAVLPFQNLSGDPEQEYFADGMVEEIITALSRIRWLFVSARNSSFTYKGQAIDVKRVGRELGVRYVLEGSVRKGGNLVRVTAQLIEAEAGAHLWADRFDGALEDIFDLQDKVASRVAGVIEPALAEAERGRVLHNDRISWMLGRPTSAVCGISTNTPLKITRKRKDFSFEPLRSIPILLQGITVMHSISFLIFGFIQTDCWAGRGRGRHLKKHNLR